MNVWNVSIDFNQSLTHSTSINVFLYCKTPAKKTEWSEQREKGCNAWMKCDTISSFFYWKETFFHNFSIAIKIATILCTKVNSVWWNGCALWLSAKTLWYFMFITSFSTSTFDSFSKTNFVNSLCSQMERFCYFFYPFVGKCVEFKLQKQCISYGDGAYWAHTRTYIQCSQSFFPRTYWEFDKVFQIFRN